MKPKRNGIENTSQVSPIPQEKETRERTRGWVETQTAFLIATMLEGSYAATKMLLRVLLARLDASGLRNTSPHSWGKNPPWEVFQLFDR